MEARGPGIVGAGEGCTVVDGWVVSEPEPEEWMRGWVVERLFAEQLKGLLAYGLRVGDDAMDGFLPIDIGFVLMQAAEAVCDRVGHNG